MECLNCGTEIIQTPKKKEKIFCDSTCRSNYWQKSKRLEGKGLTAEQVVSEIKKSWKPKNTATPEKEKQTKIPKGKEGISDFWKQRMAKKLGIK